MPKELAHIIPNDLGVELLQVTIASYPLGSCIQTFNGINP